MLSRGLSARCCNASPQLAYFNRLFTSEQASCTVPTIKSQYNQDIVNLLVQSLEEEEGKPNANPFKLQAFSKAITSVRTLNRPIRSGADVRSIKGIGPRILARINEHLFNAYKEEAEKDLEAYNEVVKSRIITSLHEVPGIGPKKAMDLTNAGCLSLDDLRSGQFDSMLSAKQILYIKYVHHLQQPILRRQAEEALEFCRHHFDPAYQFDLVGDYRRGIDSLADIQIMVSHPGFVHVPLPLDLPPGAPAIIEHTLPKPKTSRKKRGEETPTNILYSEIIPLLQQAGFVSGTLSSDFKSWKGIARLPGQAGQWDTLSNRINAIKNTEGHFRMVSFNIVPQRSLGASQICLTGNQKFEKYMCYRAQRRGVLFNQYGLWRWTMNDESPSTDAALPAVDSASEAGVGVGVVEPPIGGYWALMKCVSEEDIFRELGMDFIDPTKRSFTYTFKEPQAKLEIDYDVDF